MDLETHTGWTIAGDSISIFEREFGENEDKINEEELDEEGDHENDKMIMIMEDEEHESAVDSTRNEKIQDVICIED